MAKEWKNKEKRSDKFELIKLDNQRGSELMRQGRRIDVGAGGNSFHVDINQGLWLGSEQYTTAPYYVSMTGEITAQRLTIDNFVSPDDTGITYTGTWTSGADPTYPAGRIDYSLTVTDYFEFTFTGTSVGLNFSTGSNMGKVKVYLDGTLDETVDLYANVYIRRIMWNATDLQNVSHTIKCVVETKNASSSANYVIFGGYTLFPNDGIKLEALSNILYSYGANITTDAQGYVRTVISCPAGYVVYSLISAKFSAKVVSHQIGGISVAGSASTTYWNITDQGGNTFRYTYASGETPFLNVIVAATSTVTLSGGDMNAGNLGTFTVDAVDTSNNYFEVTNAAGVAETGKTATIIHDNPPDCPKVQWREDYFEIYDGVASTVYPMTTLLMLSKL